MKTIAVFSTLLLAGLAPGAAQEEAPPSHRYRIEVKGHFRSSDEFRFPLAFPFAPSQLPPGAERAFLATVDPGDHFELSVVGFEYSGRFGPWLELQLRVDGIDRHDRNPTSSDHAWDVDELWLRFGRETDTALVPDRVGGYVKVGKFPRFERQDDRHLESYGLVATAFNRFEDAGVEAGFDLGRYAYFKASYTQGNPIFMRDPNALAGDNGLDELRDPNPDPDLGSGVVIPYDADIEDLDFAHAEIAGAVGVRWSEPGGLDGFEAMIFANSRDLADTVDLTGTFYGGDLDLLLGPLNAFPFPVSGRTKEETGANLWLYLGGFSLFAQYVDQDLAGLGRTGMEAEAAWRFELPLVAAASGRQLFAWLAPALRYSRLEPDFAAPAITPSPSFAWDWEKWDAGLRLALIGDSDLTVELARNRFVLASGRTVENDEILATLRLRHGSL